jgi:L-ascorbate metabolism protein UlaG (beta-lactamase superfamily)
MREFTYKGIKVIWTGHAGFKLEGDIRYYFDPFRLRHFDKADVILVSHDHFDHFSVGDIGKISTESTYFVGAAELVGKAVGFPGEKVFIKPWNTYSNDKYGFTVKAVPAYNVNKFRAPGVPFHPKEDEKVGFVVDIGGVKVYHAGDTDFIPEMSKLREEDIDIAFLPVSGTYVMTAEEASKAVESIMPRVVIPMHWGAIVGGRRDAEKFKGLLKGVDVDVVLLERE